ncbi:MAG: hypothetical protein FJX59_21105 [Alphaproteobacteria bacterium]|nr:hypothetical protein [Alphaproteobacteria bacterium]
MRIAAWTKRLNPFSQRFTSRAHSSGERNRTTGALTFSNGLTRRQVSSEAALPSAKAWLSAALRMVSVRLALACQRRHVDGQADQRRSGDINPRASTQVDDLESRLQTTIALYSQGCMLLQPGSLTSATISDGAFTAAKFADGFSAAAREGFADALLGRNMAGGSNTGRTVRQAMFRLRNKSAIENGTLSVYEPNDDTVSWSAAVGTSAGNPVTSVDPD